MAVIGRCDRCAVESPARAAGINYRVPAGWFIVADGNLRTRSVELLLCSEQCVTQAFDSLPPSIKARAFSKQAPGEREVLPGAPVTCSICPYLDPGEECWEHGPKR